MVKALMRQPPGVVLITRIPNSLDPGGYWPHKVRILIPLNDPQMGITALHGGGGWGTQQANYLNMLYQTDGTDSDSNWAPENVNWGLLQKYGGVCAIFISAKSLVGAGQVWSVDSNGNTRQAYLPGKNPQNLNDYSVPKAFCWSNQYETSGLNDEQMLIDLRAYLPSVLPASVAALHLCGHSSGGMMTTALWFRHPNTFNHYITWAGPGCYNLFAGHGMHSNPPPKLDIIGEDDTTVGCRSYIDGSSQMYVETWPENPQNFNQSVVTWPDLTSFRGLWFELYDRVNAGGYPQILQTDGVVSGNKLTYATSDNKQQLVYLAGATHQFVSLTKQLGSGSLWNSMCAWILSSLS